MREFLKMKRRELKRAEIMRSPHQMSGDDWRVVGSALDYRLRFYWGLADPKELVAYRGALIASAGSAMSIDEVEMQSLFTDFFTLLDDFTDAVQRENKLNATDEDTLNRFCVALAYMEQCLRAPAGKILDTHPIRGKHRFVDDLLDIAPQYMLDDLRRLSWAFHDNYESLLMLDCVPNPMFKGSAYVGGADADIIIGNTLVDFKTTHRPNMTADVRQTLGYALLDTTDEYGIDSIGIYYARHALLLEWTLADVSLRLQRDKCRAWSDIVQEFGEMLGMPASIEL